jgi:quinoprotein glucose dehydrogenase
MDPLLRESLKIEALQCLVVWDQTPLVDRVEGRIRTPLPSRDASAGRSALQDNLLAILEHGGSGVATEAIRAARQLKLVIDTERVAREVNSEHNSAETRAEALRLLHALDAPEIDDALASISTQSPWPLRKVGLETLVERDKARAWQIMMWENASIEEQQFYVSLLPRVDLPEASQLLNSLVDSQVNATTPTPLTLDIIEAARESRDASIAAKVAQWDVATKENDRGAYAFAMAGGDARRGELLYRTHVTAQCIRCHEAGGMGKQAGPELKGIASRVDRSYLLESLVDPNAKIAKGFDSVTIVTSDGVVITGSVIQEDGLQVVIGTPQGEHVAVDKREIEARKTSSASAMPTMVSILSPLEVRDLVEYLATLTDR